VFFIVLLVLAFDQWLKIYIKTHFTYGQEVNVLGNWFKFHFIENEGMAFGMSFGGDYGKLFLTMFRLVACVAGVYFIQNLIIKKGYKNGLIFCAALILAGALGNCVDSIFYGKIFTDSSFHSGVADKFVPWGKGYADLFHGKVVDMLYFNFYEGQYPAWFPILGGRPLNFFGSIFNIADAAISGGVIAIFAFQRSLFQKKAGYETVELKAPVEESHPDMVTESLNEEIV
jgi:signal peptidase II